MKASIPLAGFEYYDQTRIVFRLVTDLPCRPAHGHGLTGEPTVWTADNVNAGQDTQPVLSGRDLGASTLTIHGHVSILFCCAEPGSDRTVRSLGVQRLSPARKTPRSRRL